jgi:N-acetylmuramoyl-L-alanine amidase
MTAGRTTRRSLLAAAGGAFATTALTHPARVLAGPAAPSLADRWLGTVAAGERTIELARNADLLGFEWQSPAYARLHLRFRLHDGHWSDWVSAGASAHGPDRPPQREALLGEPVWTGGTRAVQLRASHALRDVRLALVDVSGGVGAHRVALAAQRSAIARLAGSASLSLAAPSLQAGSGQPPIIARSVWARGIAHPRVAPEYGAVRLAFVHHTENPNGYLAGEVPAMLRAIFVFHREVRGWNDIGYNFVVDAFGRIFEARAGGIDEPVVGAHAGGYNLASTGVAVLGSFSSSPISAPARVALQRLLAWKLALHGVPAQGRVTVRVNPAGAVYSRFPANAPVSLPRIAGHRDADTTDCPGDALYRELDTIRSNVLRLAPRPTLATLALTRTSPTTPSPTTPSTATTPSTPTSPPPATGAAGVSEGLAGTLALLDGTPIAGASIQIQARSVAQRGEVVLERTLAQVQSDAEGRWSLPASVVRGAGHVSLRALYLGAVAAAGGPPEAGAAVSDPLLLASSTLTPAGAPAPTPAAAPAPAT